MTWYLNIAAKIITKNLPHGSLYNFKDDLQSLLEEHNQTAIKVDPNWRKEQKQPVLGLDIILAFLVYLEKYCSYLNMEWGEKKKGELNSRAVMQAWIHKITISAWLMALRSGNEYRIYFSDWVNKSPTFLESIIASRLELRWEHDPDMKESITRYLKLLGEAYNEKEGICNQPWTKDSKGRLPMAIGVILDYAPEYIDGSLKPDTDSVGGKKFAANCSPEQAKEVLVLWEKELAAALGWHFAVKDKDIEEIKKYCDQQMREQGIEDYLNTPVELVYQRSEDFDSGNFEGPTIRKVQKVETAPLLRKGKKPDQNSEDSDLEDEHLTPLPRRGNSNQNYFTLTMTNKDWLKISEREWEWWDGFHQLFVGDKPRFQKLKQEVLNLLPSNNAALDQVSTIFDALKISLETVGSVERNTLYVQQQFEKLRGVLIACPDLINQSAITNLLGEKNSELQIELIMELTKQSRKSVQDDIERIIEIEKLESDKATDKATLKKIERAQNHSFLNTQQQADKQKEIINLKHKIVEREILILELEKEVIPELSIENELKAKQELLNSLKIKLQEINLEDRRDEEIEKKPPSL